LFLFRLSLYTHRVATCLTDMVPSRLRRATVVHAPSRLLSQV
jgi:hypothetical protein